MKKIMSLTLVLVFLVSGMAYGAPLEQDLTGVLLADLDNDQILYEYNMDETYHIASITKLMTYLVTMEAIEDGQVARDDIVTISDYVTETWGSKFNLKAGERISLDTLIESMMIISANDACVAIAEHVAGTEEAFVERMNNKAKDLGLSEAKFINPHGLPENGKENIMTLEEVYKLSKTIIETYPETLEITEREEFPEGEGRAWKTHNTNPLLKITEGPLANIDGLKTGYTSQAGRCLITTLEVPKESGNDEPYRMIGITMGAKSDAMREKKSKEVLNYGIKNFHNKKLVTKGEETKSIEVPNAKDTEVKTYAKIDFDYVMKTDADVRIEEIHQETFEAPLEAGAEIGHLEVYVDDKMVGQVPMVVKEEVKKANIFVRLFRFIANIF